METSGSGFAGARRWSAVLAGAFIALLAARALLIFVALPHFYGASPTTYQADLFPDWYDRIAMNLVQGHGYRFYPDTTETMLRSPGFVLVLAGIFKLFGHSLFATEVFNFFFTVVTAYLVFLLGKRITASDRIGLVAAGITLLHPALLVADSRGGVESFLTLAITAFLFLVYRAIQSGALKEYIFAGIAFGIVLTTKATAALFPPFLFLYLIGLRPNRARVCSATINVGALVLAGAVVLSPWIIRNYALSGAFVPAMSVGGKAAYEGLYIVTHWNTGREHYVLVEDAAAEEQAIADQMGLRFKPGYFPQFYNISDELKYYGHLADLVKAQYMAHPSLILDAVAFNARGFWIQGRTAKATKLNTILAVPFLTLVVWGIYAGWRRSLLIAPVVLFVLTFYAAHLLIIGLARYQVPLIPLLAVLAAIPLRFVVGDDPAPAANQIKAPSRSSPPL